MVVGGGLAGLAAGVRLAKAGIAPVVLEKRPFLGGRAFSFRDPDTGVEVDNGQHVFVGACTEYIAFLREIGAWEHVRMPKRLDAPVLLDGRLSRLRAANLPGSLGNALALLRYGHLSLPGKFRLLNGLVNIQMARPGRDPALDRVTFHDWLMRHGQTAETIDRFWNLITLPALNDDIRDVSADAGIMLFRVALLGSPANAAIGYPLVGLSSLAGEAARKFIEKNGGEVRTGSDVSELMPDGKTAVRLDGGVLEESDAVISAVPPAALVEMLSGNAGSDFFAPASRLETSPIVGVHIWYDRPVMEDMFVATLGTPLQWVFNVSGMQGETGASGQHIAISLSGAWKWKDVHKRELRETFVAEMARAFPGAAEAKVERFLVVKMLDATFRVIPGSQANRLPQETPVPGFFLAGDWTRTGWPSTMEGAVRSGNLAAAAAVAFLAKDRRE